MLNFKIDFWFQQKLFNKFWLFWCLLVIVSTIPDAALAETVLNTAQTEIGQNITRILDEIFASGYDRRIRPNYAGPPVEVGVTMYILSISSVSEVQMDFTSDFFFRQGWRDPRLSFTPRPGIDTLYVGAEVAEKIWLPDTFFANEKSAIIHMATTPNTFIRLRANGDVLISTRITVTSSCPMNLQYFPMDRQACTIEVESYGYSMTDIMYRWGIDGKGSVGIADNVQLPQFKIKGYHESYKTEYLSTGNYSRLVCELEFVRSMGYYLIQIYVPASLIVIISWVSFWLHRNASPARVQLGVTTVLTMTTLMSSTNAALPKISYIKSIDVYLGTCFVMVFASLLEYATVGYMGKRIAMRKQRSQQLEKLAASVRAPVHYQNSNIEAGTKPNGPSHAKQNSLPVPSICFVDDPWQINQTLPRPRNSSEMRYRPIGAPPTKLSLDFSKKNTLRVPLESDTESSGESTGVTPVTPTPSTPFPIHAKTSNPLFGAGSNDFDRYSLFGVCPSDIDKYSRVVFPVCFLCFNLMYWIIYMHISEFFSADAEE